MWLPWQEYLTDLKSPALVGPGLRSGLPPRLRNILHVAFTTLRYISFYLFFRPMAWLIIHAMCDLHLQGRENLPRKGQNGVCTPNHLSQLDPMIAVIYTPRPIYVMVKAEYFSTPLLGGTVMLLGGFPVRRGEADRQAIKTALGAVKQGNLLCIFPEGTRSKSYTLQPGHPGAALIAATSDTLVWPVGIWGSENIARRHKLGFLRRPRVELVIGKPYNLKEEAAAFASTHGLEPTNKRGREDLDLLSEVMMLKIAELLPPEYQGEFTPENVVTRYKARLSHKKMVKPGLS